LRARNGRAIRCHEELITRFMPDGMPFDRLDGKNRRELKS